MVDNDILAPKLRFKGFNDNWKQYKLNDVVVFLDNKRVPLNEEERKAQKNIYPYYGASGIIGYVENYIFNEDLILLGEDGTIGVNLATGKYWVNNHAHVLKAKNNINQYLLFEYLKNIHYEKYNTGTIQPKLNKEACKTIPIILPKTLEEQNKLATFFKALDNKINLMKQQLKQMEDYKKAMVQQMLKY